MISSVVNPLIYGFFNKDFRSFVSLFLRRCCCCFCRMYDDERHDTWIISTTLQSIVYYGIGTMETYNIFFDSITKICFTSISNIYDYFYRTSFVEDMLTNDINIARFHGYSLGIFNLQITNIIDMPI
jgi:hypothetical protein